MKILFLCNKSPWPPKEGGPMAMNMLIEGMASAGHTVRVLAINSYKFNLSPEEIPASYRVKTGIELVDVDLRIRPLPALLHLARGTSYHVGRFISEAFRSRLAEILAAGDFDIVQLETLFLCPYIDTIRQHSGARIILRAHNVEHRIWQRIAEETGNPLKRWYLRKLAESLKRYEEQAVGLCDGIAAITPTDGDYFRSAVGSRQPAVGSRQSTVTPPLPGERGPGGEAHPSSAIPVIDLPYGVDPDQYQSDPAGIEFPSLFSIGAMNWRPNEEGIRWFLDNVWPDIHRQFPGLKYYLAGREMPSWMQTLDIPGVTVLGEVPDAASFLATKAIMIVPLFSGSGIRIKIIEGMAAGKTVISTSIGAEGIAATPLENILLADAPCEFYEMISLCVTDRALHDRIGISARQLVADRYAPDFILRKLEAFYKQLLA